MKKIIKKLKKGLSKEKGRGNINRQSDEGAARDH